MFKNYFKIAWRNLWKNKSFTLLNVGGLTISFAACLIIFFWVNDEWNYDTAASNAGRVYRVALTLEAASQPDKQFAATAPPLAPVLLKDYPEIEKAVRFTPSSVLLGYKNEHFFTDNFLYADADFFDVFGYSLIEGNTHTALNKTNSAVITERMAQKLFGSIENAMGKTIIANDTTLLQVTGVAKNLPANNHFHFDVVGSVKLLGADALQGWWNDSYYTYILLKNAKAAPSLESKIATVMDKYNAAQNKEIGLRGLHFLQPVKSIHLYSNLRGELETNGNISLLRIFIGIAVFLLIVACINYINLTTSNSFKRAKEIGVRKVAGAAFFQLVAQFLSEAILTAIIALLLSIMLAQFCLPFFNNLIGTQISLSDHLSFSVIAIFALVAILLGMISGLYPALYLSGIQPIKALKKISEKTPVIFSLRKVLVVFQFSLSIILIIATTIALQQLHYMQTQNSGFNKDQVVAVTLRNQAESNAYEIIKKEFEKNNGVSLAASSSSTPGNGLNNITVLPEGVPKEHIQTMNTLVVDYDFIDTYQLSLAAGRAFSKKFGSDSSAFILNETAVKELGWNNQNAIGERFEWGLGKKGTIIGVVKDFHFNALQQKVLPVVMHIMPVSSGWYGYISIRLNTASPKPVIASLENSWKKIFPEHPFEYFFVDEDYNKQYQGEQRLSSLSALFSALVIFISCLGLFGLVMIAVTQRTKEIGIRKVLGASVPGIALLLSKDFIKLVFLASVIAFPLAWFAMHTWLQDFAYRITISWWVFIMAGLGAAVIAMVTISFQAIKAAIANPVKSLRTE